MRLLGEPGMMPFFFFFYFFFHSTYIWNQLGWFQKKWDDVCSGLQNPTCI
jgi:hypothetical protein